MEFLSVLWLPILLSGVLVFVASSLIHMVLKYHNSEFKPLPGEEIIGYVTRGRGVTIHRRDCPNILRMTGEDLERLIEVEWGGAEASAHPVKIRVYCDDRKGILATVTQTLAGFDVNVSRADVRTSAAGHAELNFEILVENLDRLQKILGSIRNIKGVSRVVRIKR